MQLERLELLRPQSGIINKASASTLSERKKVPFSFLKQGVIPCPMVSDLALSREADLGHFNPHDRYR